MSNSHAPVSTEMTTGTLEPNDPAYLGTVLNRPDVTLWGMKNINGAKAWSKQTDANSIIVAVIDEGIDPNHNDLASNLLPDDSQFGGFISSDDHGTHCAGTIGAVGNNGRGVVGVCWNVKMMNIRFLGSSHTAGACVKHAVDNGAAVLSNSWTSFSFFDQGLFDAIEYAKEKNVLFVAAAANHGGDNDLNANYPSSYENENLVAVGAIDINEQRATFSAFGKTRVDLFAPGVDIWSTMPGNRLQPMSGTSMACPHVAGACALVWANKGRKTNWSVVRSFILDNARPVTALKNLCVTGGTLDLSKLGEAGIVTPDTGVAAGALLASDTFTADSTVTPTSDGVLRSVKVTLAKPMAVVVGASFDAQTIGGDSTFKVSIASANQTWDGGDRNVSGATGKWTAVGLHAVKQLAAGEHTIQLQTTASSSSAKFGAGTITVTGYPVQSGGTMTQVKPAKEYVPTKVTSVVKPASK
jgi:subtilisin family serine protease